MTQKKEHTDKYGKDKCATRKASSCNRNANNALSKMLSGTITATRDAFMPDLGHRFEPRLNPKRLKLEDDPRLHYARGIQQHFKLRRLQLDDDRGLHQRRYKLEGNQGLHQRRLRDRHPRRLKLEGAQGLHRRRLTLKDAQGLHPRRASPNLFPIRRQSHGSNKCNSS